jgi:NADH dehydrogenase FAD-containing subunit
MNARANIVIAGGGFAGLESAFLLRRKLRDRARITLVSDRPDFLFKPNTIYIPFGGKLDPLLIPLSRPTAKRDIELVEGRVTSVEPDARRIDVNGRNISYDFLVLATGAGMAPAEVPGLQEHAETIWTPEEMAALGRKLAESIGTARKGEPQTILFTVPPGNKCAGPLYEIVLMTDTYLRRQRVRDRFALVWATYERTYIQAFGPKLHDVVVPEFAARGIQGHTGWTLDRVEERAAQYTNGETLAFDLLVAFPPYVAAVRYDGLPRDERGFLTTELETRRVTGQERIYAPGDAGDFPVKQAFLAFLQADATAEAIAAEVAEREPTQPFDPVSMCVMEEFDKATFAQVPLELTGDPHQPVAVRPDANGTYRVGVSPLWRIGKKMLAFYLPFRFKAGHPFHAGAPWRAMELGLQGMSAALARR